MSHVPILQMEGQEIIRWQTAEKTDKLQTNRSLCGWTLFKIANKYFNNSAVGKKENRPMKSHNGLFGNTSVIITPQGLREKVLEKCKHVVIFISECLDAYLKILKFNKCRPICCVITDYSNQQLTYICHYHTYDHIYRCKVDSRITFKGHNIHMSYYIFTGFTFEWNTFKSHSTKTNSWMKMKELLLIISQDQRLHKPLWQKLLHAMKCNAFHDSCLYLCLTDKSTSSILCCGSCIKWLAFVWSKESHFMPPLV